MEVCGGQLEGYGGTLEAYKSLLKKIPKGQKPNYFFTAYGNVCAGVWYVRGVALGGLLDERPILGRRELNDAVLFSTNVMTKDTSTPPRPQAEAEVLDFSSLLWSKRSVFLL